MRLRAVWVAALLALMAALPAGAPRGEEPATAVPRPAPPAASPAPPAAAIHRLVVDPARSEARFVLATTWHHVQGSTRDVSGELTSESGDPFVDGRVVFEVRAASLKTGNERRDRTMREDHLMVEEHPLIRFASTSAPEVSSIRRNPNGAVREATLLVAGDLTIRGATRRVSLPVTARREADGYLVAGEIVVRLSDHGIPDPSIFVNKVQDAVGVAFEAFLRPSR